MMPSAKGFVALNVAGVINGVGCGILLPTVVTWTMRTLPMARRGFGNGAFQSCLFFGQFINPIVVVALQEAVGGPRVAAVGAMGWVLAAMGLVALTVAALRKG